MSQAAVLNKPLSLITSLDITLEGLTSYTDAFEKLGSETQEQDQKFNEIYGENYYGFNYFPQDKKEKISITQLYYHFKNKEFSAVIRDINKLKNKDITESIKNYVSKANGIKIQKIIFGVKESLRKLFKKQNEYEILKDKLKDYAREANNYLRNFVKTERIKRITYPTEEKILKGLKELTQKERQDILIYREQGISANELKNKYNLKDRRIVYKLTFQENQKKKRALINRVKEIVDKNARYLDDIIDDIHKAERRTLGRLSYDEILEISRKNKQEKIRAEDLAKQYRLSNKWVIYSANRKIKQEKIKEIENPFLNIPLIACKPNSVYLH